jgi:hypothetical protein
VPEFITTSDIYSIVIPLLFYSDPLVVLLTAITLSLAIMGLWICFNWQGMIFEPLAYHIEELCYRYRLPHYLLKPLWSCPTCMSSFWGLIFYIACGHSWLTIAQMIVVLPITAFINTLFCIALDKISDEGCG